MKLSLRLKTAAAIVFTGLLIGAVTVIISYLTYSNTMDEHYMTLTTDLADTAIEMVDHSLIRKYADTLEADEHYGEQLDILRRIRDANQVECIYILQADGAETCTILDTDGVELGHRDPQVTDTPQDMTGKVYISNTESFGWLCSAMRWMRDESGYGYALMCVDISMNDVMADRAAFLRLVVVAIVIAVASVCVLMSMLVDRTIVRPIRAVSDASARYISDRRGGTSAISRLSIRTGDEIEGLAAAIQTMEHEINEYISDLTAVTAEKERIGAELDVARHIQAAMLPSIFPAFPDRPEFDIYATMDPAKEVGGDFYDFFLVDDDHLALVMADVSGKGVPAALFMMISKTLLKSAAQQGLSPKAVLEKVNGQLCENNDAEMFVTVWLGILEISTGKLTCANAGHEYPAVRRADGAFELFRDRHGFVLAGMEGSRYREYQLDLGPGDMLFVYTDGVAEATDARSELYGTGRMLAALDRHRDRPLDDMLRGVKADIDAFVGEAPQFDDITMLCLRLRGAAGMTGLDVAASLDEMERVAAFFEEAVAAAGAPPKAAAQVAVAVDEIFSNIARYSGASAVTAAYRTAGNGIELRFTDDGAPYDPTSTPDPDITLGAEDREIGGLGIYMVKKSMDSVTYEHRDGRNVLTLKKSWS